MFGQQASAGAGQPPVPPGEQDRINQLQAQYSAMCACAKCANGVANGDQMLNKIKQESLSHIMAHEQAHQSTAGSFGGAIHIDFDQNGVAIGGHVPINMPGLDRANPEDSVKAYQTIRAAALAPEDPSGQDFAVAAKAQAMMGRAQVMMGQKKQAQSLGLPLDVYLQKLGGGAVPPGTQPEGTAA